MDVEAMSPRNMPRESARQQQAHGGVCPANTVSVFRAYNDGFSRKVDSNHRITSNAASIQEVVARGWINEGVVMCAPK